MPKHLHFFSELIPAISLMLPSALLPNVLFYTQLVGAPMFHNKIVFGNIVERRRVASKKIAARARLYRKRFLTGITD
jgi:hypothetical protein